MGKSKRSLAEFIVRELRRHGHEAYFVGGSVRDMILKKRPSDFDIATDARPGEIRRYFEKCVPVGEAFGVMIVLVSGRSFEVASFRTESDYRDGRRPSRVSFADARSDVMRRDFTVNGLFYDPVKRETLDWVGGVRDIHKKIIRTIGDPLGRFREDKLRMLRAVRFATNLNFRMDQRTFRAIRRMAGEIRVVSRERIRDELIKLFTGPYPGKGFHWLDKTGLLKVILPEIDRMKGVPQPRRFHPEGDVFRHTQFIMDELERPPTVLAFGSLLHDVGKPRTFRRADRIRFDGHDRVGGEIAARILTRLRFPNEVRDQVVACVEGHMRFKDVKRMKLSTLKKMFQRPTFYTELEQHKADCLASHKDLSVWRFLKRKLKTLSEEDIRPLPLVRGRDLIALGFEPGPEMGRLLRQIEEKQLEGIFQTKEEALQWARSR